MSLRASAREPAVDPGGLDFARLVRNLGDDEAAARRLLALFEDQAPRLLAGVEQGLAAGDARGVERHAHQLKGALRWIAAEQASQAAAEVEALARERSLGSVAETLPPLRAAVERVLASIHALG